MPPTSPNDRFRDTKPARHRRNHFRVIRRRQRRVCQTDGANSFEKFRAPQNPIVDSKAQRIRWRMRQPGLDEPFIGHASRRLALRAFRQYRRPIEPAWCAVRIQVVPITSPNSIFRPRDLVCSAGIEMHIAAQFPGVRFVLDHDVVEPRLKQRPVTLVPPIEQRGITAFEIVHPSRQRRDFQSEEEMKVVIH